MCPVGTDEEDDRDDSDGGMAVCDDGNDGDDDSDDDNSNVGREVCNDGSWDGDGDEDTCHHCLHSNEDERHTYFYNLLRGVAGSELVIREDMALAAIRAGSAEEFSPYEMQQLLRRCEEECEIMRSRGNIYFV